MLATLGLLTAELNVSLYFGALCFGVFLWIFEPRAWRQATFFCDVICHSFLSYMEYILFFSTNVGGQQAYCILWRQHISILTWYSCGRWMHENEFG